MLLVCVPLQQGMDVLLVCVPLQQGMDVLLVCVPLQQGMDVSVCTCVCRHVCMLAFIHHFLLSYRSVLSRIESEFSLDVDVSDSGGQATPTTSVMDPFEKMNNLTTEEIRDLLASVMFVLKHVDNSKNMSGYTFEYVWVHV